MISEQLYLSIINNLRDGVYYVDNDRVIQFWNTAAQEITGYSAAEMLGKPCPETQLHHIDDEGRPLCRVGCPLHATLSDGRERAANVFVRHKSGHRIPITVKVFPFYAGGEIAGAVEIFTPNSPKVYQDDLIERLSSLALHDALTGLPNRRYLESFLDYKLREFDRFDKPFALMLADIDDFSKFNDRYGHETGDAVLCSIAASLKNSARSADLVGRWGGEEFVGIYALSPGGEVAAIAERFRRLIAGTEVVYGERALSVSVSVGITQARPGDTARAIAARADRLMYQSKAAGKDRVTSG